MDDKEIIKLAKIINKEFRYPFIEEGMVKAKVTTTKKGKTLSITICGRDIELDGKLNVLGSGTCI
jgi:hypothetical protein